MTYINRIETTNSDDASVDSFFRRRMSQPFTLFDSAQINDNQPLFWDEETSGTGVSTYSISGSSTLMEVSTDGDYVIRQTKERFKYQAGKSQLVVITGVISTPAASGYTYLGYYNSDSTGDYSTGYDGIMFESNSDNVYCVIHKSGTLKHKVAQSSWNLDVMDGSGGENNPSGVNIDWNMAQIFFIDFEWLGVGRVRWGLYINGKPYYVHEFNNANNFDSVYMSSPNHSIRYEVRSSGGLRSLLHICSTVSSEGGVDLKPVVRSVETGGAVTVGNGANESILAIRLKDNYEDAIVSVAKLNLYNSSGNDNIRWYLTFNATLTTPITEATPFTSLTNSSIEYLIPDDTVTNEGIVVDSGFLTSSSDETNSTIESALRLGRKIDGTRDIIYLCIQNIGATGTSDIWANLIIRELM